MKRKVLFVVVILALLVSAVAVLRVVRFSVVNDSDYPVTVKMTYVSDKDGQLTPYDFVYLADIPPDGKTKTYSVVKTPYYLEWWGGEGVCLKPAIGLTYDVETDGLLLKPVVSTVLRFKQCYNMPNWYWDWLERWDLKWNYLYHY